MEAAASEPQVAERPARVPRVWVLVALAYSAAAMLVPPFTVQQYVVTAIPCAVVVTTAVRRGWLRPGPLPSAPAGVPGPAPVLALWIVLIGVAIAVQLFHFFDAPRDVYPTLSSLASLVFDVYPVRVAAFAAWLGLGWYLLDR